MSNYNSFILPSIQTKNENQCLEQYYRYIVGMSMNQQQQQPKINTINDLTQYQKVYVDTLVGKTINIDRLNLHKSFIKKILSIDITTLTIRTSWPMEISTTNEGQPVVNTHAFVRHLLKRSRATRSTLQLAIFYLFRIRPYINKRSQFDPIVKCGRRMFLAALICAHKYLYDNTFTNASWAKISKLPVKEINQAERALLEMLDYRLYVSTELYQKFEAQLKEAIPQPPTPSTTLVGKRTYQDIITTTTTTPVHTSIIQQRPIKKPKQSISTRFTYGIPTPEDDKVEL